MASRVKQKEEARKRRLAEEQAHAALERRGRRLRMSGGLVLSVVAVVAVVVAIASGGSSKTSGRIVPAPGKVKLPALSVTNLPAAAKAAGCVLTSTPDSIARISSNRTHVAPGTKVPYATNPPSYGPHYPMPASDGEYKPNATPATGYLLHALEHGRIEYQYRPGTPTSEVKQLEALFSETDGPWAPGQLLLLFENHSRMPYAIAATAWGHVLGCRTFNPKIFDALRDFRLSYTNQAPEQLGTGPE